MHLYQEIVDHIQNQIESGMILPGQKLPSIRALSRQRSVSRNTVILAYHRLTELGVVQSQERAGYRVLATQTGPRQCPERVDDLVPSTPRPDALALSVVRSAAHGELAPLGSAHPSGEFHALQHFRRIYGRHQRNARRNEVKLTRYEVPPGHRGLRQRLATHMARSGAVVDPEEIVITNGCQEALSLALQTLLKPGDIVAVESPSFYGTLQCIEVLGLQVLEIPTDPLNGMDLELLQQVVQRWPVKAILVNPVFNNPQGHVMSEQAARRLVALAKTYDLPIIEDDVFGDISYDRQRPKSVRAWDDEGRVLLCSSLSKNLDSDLRLGWVAAGRYSQQIAYRKYVTTMASRGLIQSAAEAFLAGGRFPRHLALLGRSYRERRDITLNLINRLFPDSVKVNFPRGGFLCWVEMPQGVNSNRLYTRLMKRGISITPGSLFSTQGRYDHYLRINYACVDSEIKYTNIFNIISDNIKELCDEI